MVLGGQRMPKVFSADFLHQLSSLLPHLFYCSCRGRKTAQWSTELNGKKKKENKWEQFSEEGGGESKKGQNSSLITALSSPSLSQEGSVDPLVLNVLVIVYNGVTFFSCLEYFWQQLGKMPPGRSFLACELSFCCDSPECVGFNAAVWLQLWTSRTNTLYFPSLFLLNCLFHCGGENL